MSVKEHSFEVEHAKKFGVDEAIIIANLAWWIKKNMANNKHFRDGRTWTYNSVRAYSALFPYWTPKQIRRIIASLVEKNVILMGEFNPDSTDRTAWYAFVEEEKFIPKDDQDEGGGICPNGQMHLPKRATLDVPKWATQHSTSDDKQIINKDAMDDLPERVSPTGKAKILIDHLNIETGRTGNDCFRVTSERVRTINARLAEIGNDIDGAKIAISRKVREWKDHPTMSQYLNPSTLFRPSNFLNYYEQRSANIVVRNGYVKIGIEPKHEEGF